MSEIKDRLGVGATEKVLEQSLLDLHGLILRKQEKLPTATKMAHMAIKHELLVLTSVYENISWYTRIVDSLIQWEEYDNMYENLKAIHADRMDLHEDIKFWRDKFFKLIEDEH